jgi:hypothetical protein
MKSKVYRIGGKTLTITNLGIAIINYQGRAIKVKKLYVQLKAGNKQEEGYMLLQVDGQNIKGLGLSHPKTDKIVWAPIKDKLTIKDLSKVLKYWVVHYEYFKKKLKPKQLSVKEAFEVRLDVDDFKEKKSKMDRLLWMLSKWAGALSVITVLFGILLILYFLRKIIEVKLAEYQARKLEKEIASELFKDQEDMPLEDYSELITALKSLINSKTINGVLVFGPPGTGKSYIVRRTLYLEKANYLIFKGSAMQLTDLVYLLYQHRSDKIIVLDDFDTMLRDDDTINILKAAADSYPKRIITIPQLPQTSTDTLQISNLPSQFVFTSKIVLITNKTRDQIPRPLLSRMYPVEIEFSSEKMVKILEKMLKWVAPDVSMKTKLEILEYLKELQKRCRKLTIDFRVFQAAIDFYRMMPNKWKEQIRRLYCTV